MESIIAWKPHGRAFVVLNSGNLEKSAKLCTKIVHHLCELSLLNTIAEYQNKDVNKLNS